jgi:hypothetical protein
VYGSAELTLSKKPSAIAIFLDLCGSWSVEQEARTSSIRQVMVQKTLGIPNSALAFVVGCFLTEIICIFTLSPVGRNITLIKMHFVYVIARFTSNRYHSYFLPIDLITYYLLL